MSAPLPAAAGQHTSTRLAQPISSPHLTLPREAPHGGRPPRWFAHGHLGARHRPRYAFLKKNCDGSRFPGLMKIQSVTAFSGTFLKLFFTTRIDGTAPTVP